MARRFNYYTLERCSTRAACAYGARNSCLSPIAISAAVTGSDKASNSHYDVIGDWAQRAGHAQRYGRMDALPCL